MNAPVQTVAAIELLVDGSSFSFKAQMSFRLGSAACRERRVLLDPESVVTEDMLLMEPSPWAPW